MTDDTRFRSDRPYSGPTDAIAHALRMYDFDTAATGSGPVRLEVIADFQEEGCLIYKVALHPVQKPQTRTPDYGVVSHALRVLAEVKQVPGPTYLLAASPQDMDTLNGQFKGLTPEQVEAFVRNPDSRLDLEPAFAVLRRLVEDCE